MQLRVIVLLLSLVASAVAVARADRFEDPPTRLPFSTFPMDVAEWRGQPEAPLSEAVLKVLGADDVLTRAYFLRKGEGVGLYMGFWNSQRQGDTIHSPLNCLPASGWEPIFQGHLTMPDPRGSANPITVNRYLVRKGIDRQLVLYWYQSHGRVIASEYTSKFFLVADAARMNRSDGAIVRVIAPVLGDSAAAETAAEQLAIRFINVLMPRLDGYLPL